MNIPDELWERVVAFVEKQAKSKWHSSVPGHRPHHSDFGCSLACELDKCLLLAVKKVKKEDEV